MSKPTEDDLEAIPVGKLPTLPGGSIPLGWALELSGNSGRHLMIFPGMDPKENSVARKLIAAALESQEMKEYAERSNRLLARIDEHERQIVKRLQEIEDRAIKLLDGPRLLGRQSVPRRERQCPAGKRP